MNHFDPILTLLPRATSPADIKVRNCCEATRLRSRLIQAAYVTTMGSLCPKPESFEICWMQVYHQIGLDFVALESRRLSTTRPWIKWGAFHSTKKSGLKFRKFHAVNGTTFSGNFPAWLHQPVPGHSRSRVSRQNTKTKQNKNG